MKTLFITGSSGFIGRHLIQRMNHKNFETIYCLSRTPRNTVLNLPASENIKFIEAGMFDSHLYSESLASSDIVVHLAARTGKGKPQEYFSINAKGTKFLVNQCERLGVKKFLFISSIAVNFDDISRYFYAQSKLRAEDAVRASGLNYTILRTTIVLGKEAPVWKSLSKLAKGPVTVVFGNGKTKIQPIYVDDLVDCILSVIYENNFLNEAFDVGGPEIVSFGDFLSLSHTKYHGHKGPVIHVPLSVLIPLLNILEKCLYSVLPINVGQLSSFNNDGTIGENTLCDRHLSNMRRIEEILDLILIQEKKELENNRIVNECDTFCRYLINKNANDYVLQKYLEGHRFSDVERSLKSSPFERFLITFGTLSTACAKLVDSYTRFFAKRSVFRKKLVLLLAILESTAPYHSYFDAVDHYGKLRLCATILMKVSFFVFPLIVSFVVISPFRLAFALFSKLRGLS